MRTLRMHGSRKRSTACDTQTQHFIIRSREGCNFSLAECQSRRETYFRKNSPIWIGRTFLGSTSCWSYVTLPPLASSCEGDNGIPMFLSLTCWPRSTHGRNTCFAAALFPHRASRCSVPSTTPSNPRRLSTNCHSRVSAKARAPRNQSCTPILPTVS